MDKGPYLEILGLECCVLSFEVLSNEGPYLGVFNFEDLKV
jgi:hypothetical protein